MGREVEMDALRQHVGQAALGNGRVVLVSGMSGSGKSALVKAVLAQSDAAAFTGRTSGQPGAPYGLAAMAWGAAWQALPAKSAMRRQAPPALRGIVTDGEPNDDRDAARLAQALTMLAGDAGGSDRATVVVLEDIHRADTATIELLPCLGDSLRGQRVCVIATLEGDSLPRTHRLRWARNELRRQHALHEIQIGPLTPEATEALAAHILGAKPSAALAQAILARTGGLPAPARHPEADGHRIDKQGDRRQTFPEPTDRGDACGAGAGPP